MLQPLIKTNDGLLHGVKQGTFGRTMRQGTGTWCGHYLGDIVANQLGEYISKEHQEMGYDVKKAVTCIHCLSEGPT